MTKAITAKVEVITYINQIRRHLIIFATWTKSILCSDVGVVQSCIYLDPSCSLNRILKLKFYEITVFNTEC